MHNAITQNTVLSNILLIFLIATKIWSIIIQGSVQEDLKQTEVRISDLNTCTRESCHAFMLVWSLLYIYITLSLYLPYVQGIFTMIKAMGILCVITACLCNILNLHELCGILISVYGGKLSLNVT